MDLQPEGCIDENIGAGHLEYSTGHLLRILTCQKSLLIIGGRRQPQVVIKSLLPPGIIRLFIAQLWVVFLPPRCPVSLVLLALGSIFSSNGILSDFLREFMPGLVVKVVGR